MADAAGDTAADLAKISAVAQEIVRTTGLRVQPVLGTTDTTRVVDLPAGLHGRPPLKVDEVWYRSDVRTTVWTALDLDSIVLVELELLAGEVGIGWGTWRCCARGGASWRRSRSSAGGAGSWPGGYWHSSRRPR